MSGVYNCCIHPLEVPDLLSDKELAELVDKIILKVWKEKGMPKRLNSDLIKYYAETFFDALQESYGKNLGELETDTPDYEMLKRLQADVFHFSAAKDYSQLVAISREITGPDGKLREFSEFKTFAYQVTKDHNQTWLRTEYEFAVASGQMASQWVYATANKDVLPFLRYSAVRDKGTTQTCIRLDGVVRKVDDEFWSMWFPPNHWRCRSDVMSEPDATETDLSEIQYPDNIPEMFKGNLAKDGLAFPAGHPYYTGNPEMVQKTASKLNRKYGQR